MLRSIFLSIFFLLIFSYSIDAQSIRRSSFRVDSPTAIRGFKMMTPALSSSVPPSWGRGVDSVWEDVSVALDPANLDGCSAFSPGFFTGKFALIDRGNCSYDIKALNAQQAGAAGVIIINNLIGVEALEVGPLSPSVNIPVVMLSLIDGNALKNQIAQGPKVSLSGWRFDSIANPVDIGFVKSGVVLPQGRVMPSHQLSTMFSNTDIKFRLYSGGLFNNYSIQNWDTVLLKGSLSQGTTLLSSDSIRLDVGATTTDSVFTRIRKTVNNILVGHDLNDFPIGTYTMHNEIQADPSIYAESGLAPLDNSWSYNFDVHDSIYSKAEHLNGELVANNYIKSKKAGEWGQVLYIRNDGFMAKAISTIIMRNNFQDSIYTGQKVELTIYSWNDVDMNDHVDHLFELTTLGRGERILTALDYVPLEGLKLFIPLDNILNPLDPIVLGSGRYWVTIKLAGTSNSFAVGTDFYSDYGTNWMVGLKPNYPLLYDGIMFQEGFENWGSPCIALHMSKSKYLTNVGLSDRNQEGIRCSLYPNPASSEINVSLNLNETTKEATYVVVDMTGKEITTQVSKNVSSDIVTFNTSSYAVGTYFLTVHTELGSKKIKFSVK